MLAPNSKYCRLLKIKYHAYYNMLSCLLREVKLSQPYRSPDSLFKGTVSEYGLCTVLCGLSVSVLSQTFYGTPTCFTIKKDLIF